MKKENFSLVGACITLLALHLQLCAGPTGNSNLGREYLLGSTGLDKWSTGLFGGIGERSLSRNGSDFNMEFTRGMAFIGYDVLNWITAYSAIGVKNIEFNNIDTDKSTTEFGFGVQMNILDQEIMDPTLIEDRLRVNAHAYVGFNEADWQSEAFEWMELSGSLTVSIVNDIDGNPYYTPVSVALFAGPAYSHLESDDFDTEERWGLTGGLEVFFTKRVAMNLSVTQFDQTTYMGSTSIRF